MHGSRVNTIDACLLAWCSGISIPLLLTTLPGGGVLWLLGLGGLILIVGGRTATRNVGGWLMLGLCYGGLSGQHALQHRLPECADGTDAQVVGEIRTLTRAAALTRLEVAVEQATVPLGEACVLDIERVRLSWRDTPALAPGERWRFTARLRRPRGLQNPSGFDYEGWLLARGLDATGYVRNGVRLAPAEGPIEHWRERLRQRIEDADLPSTDVMVALILGDTGTIDPGRWQLLRRTGTVHLLIVSGLHVGFVAGLGMMLGRWLCSWPALLRLRPARSYGNLLGILCATGYAALAGWSLPVQRAWLMTLLMASWLQFGRQVSLGRWFLLALSAVLSLHPLAAALAGFWLSFGAVALLLAFFAPRPSRSWPWRLLGVQLLLLIGMSPILAVTSGELSVVAPLANLVAVPLVSLLVVPLALLGALLSTVLSSVGGEVLSWVDALIRMLFAILESTARLAHPISVSLEGTNRFQSLINTGLALTVIAAFCLPQPWLSRALLVGALGTMLASTPPRPEQGDFQLRMFDVGQGLSIHVRTAGHDLLYDAGARYPSGFDLGQAVVVPAVRGAGTERLDGFVISHSDNDHRGGAASVITALTPRWTVAGELGDARCAQGQRWQWDGVRVEVVHPTLERVAGTGNDQSCVLLVSGREVQALLPGDIERRAEARLITRTLGTIDLLAAPHHGSRTSSTRPFLKHVGTRLVLVSSGYENPFGHPHPEVLSRYARYGINWFSTAQGGALTWSSAMPGRVIRHRDGNVTYWRAARQAVRPATQRP
jgi:competence protein ComEC